MASRTASPQLPPSTPAGYGNALSAGYSEAGNAVQFSAAPSSAILGSSPKPASAPLPARSGCRRVVCVRPLPVGAVERRARVRPRVVQGEGRFWYFLQATRAVAREPRQPTRTGHTATRHSRAARASQGKIASNTSLRLQPHNSTIQREESALRVPSACPRYTICTVLYLSCQSRVSL